jgi:hypothetical protein
MTFGKTRHVRRGEDLERSVADLHFSLSPYRSAREWTAKYAAQHAEVEDARGQGNDANQHHYNPDGICPVRESPPDEGEAGDGAHDAAGTRSQELRKSALSERHGVLE